MNHDTAHNHPTEAASKKAALAAARAAYAAGHVGSRHSASNTGVSYTVEKKGVVRHARNDNGGVISDKFIKEQAKKVSH